MTILNEPIGTWISIAAILISISTLLLSLRKQRYDERTALANKMAEIKAGYGEAIRILDEILRQNDSLESLQVDDTNIETIHENHSSLTKLKSKMENTYNKLGYQSIKTTDPVVLSAIAIEINDIKKVLERGKDDFNILTLKPEKKFRQKKKVEKSINRKTNRKKN